MSQEIVTALWQDRAVKRGFPFKEEWLCEEVVGGIGEQRSRGGIISVWAVLLSGRTTQMLGSSRYL